MLSVKPSTECLLSVIPVYLIRVLVFADQVLYSQIVSPSLVFHV
jgi:hypothetical protein